VRPCERADLLVVPADQWGSDAADDGDRLVLLESAGEGGRKEGVAAGQRAVARAGWSARGDVFGGGVADIVSLFVLLFL